MPMYRFAVNDGQHVDMTDAIDLPSDSVAIKDAHRALAELVADLAKGARADFRVAVEDASGRIIYQASLTFRGEAMLNAKRH